MNQQANPAKIHARRFFFGLALLHLAVAATVWVYIGPVNALLFIAGGATVLAYAFLAPSYEPPPPDPEDAGDAEPERGYD